MIYHLNDETIWIPDKELENSMKILNLTKDEAIQMWLEDEGFAKNETVEELTKKAKENKISHDAKSLTPRKPVKRERKPDEEKESLIELVTKCLTDAGYTAEIVNKSKLIEFSVGGNHYKLDLIKQRAKKS